MPVTAKTTFTNWPLQMHSILLVDDDPEILAAWQAILLDEGYRVCCARNGFQALERLKESIPDLVITDWMMPLMGGAELCRQLKAHPDLGRAAQRRRGANVECLPAQARAHANFSDYDRTTLQG
jgi:CheY-like chemotaxis protein